MSRCSHLLHLSNTTSGRYQSFLEVTGVEKHLVFPSQRYSVPVRDASGRLQLVVILPDTRRVDVVLMMRNCEVIELHLNDTVVANLIHSRQPSLALEREITRKVTQTLEEQYRQQHLTIMHLESELSSDQSELTADRSEIDALKMVHPRPVAQDVHQKIQYQRAVEHEVPKEEGHDFHVITQIPHPQPIHPVHRIDREAQAKNTHYVAVNQSHIRPIVPKLDHFERV